jgi:hypothetical protein
LQVYFQIRQREAYLCALVNVVQNGEKPAHGPVATSSTGPALRRVSCS